MSDLPRESVAKFSQFAMQLADDAREITLRHFRRQFTVETKSDRTPVTIADRDTEQRLREAIAAAYPDHVVWGEEFGLSTTSNDFTWIIDPIDGTQSYIRGVPTFGTLIGLLHLGEPIVGVVDIPALDERWSGARGHTTTYQGRIGGRRECAVSAQMKLSNTTMFATSPAMFEGADAAVFSKVTSACASTRFGLDCYAYGLLASGHIDAVMESSLQAYDYLPLVPVITGAGGVMCDWTGKPLGMTSGCQVLAAATPELADTILAYTKPE